MDVCLLCYGGSVQVGEKLQSSIYMVLMIYLLWPLFFAFCPLCPLPLSLPPPPSSCRTITFCRRYNYLIHAYMYIQKSIQTSIQTSEQTYVQALLRIFRAALIVNWPWCNFLLLLLFPSVFRHLLYTVPSHPSHHPSLISYHPLWP